MTNDSQNKSSIKEKMLFEFERTPKSVKIMVSLNGRSWKEENYTGSNS